MGGSPRAANKTVYGDSAPASVTTDIRSPRHREVRHPERLCSAPPITSHRFSRKSAAPRTRGCTNSSSWADNSGQFPGDDAWPKNHRFLYDYDAPTNPQIAYN